MSEITRSEAEALDHADELSQLRDRFVFDRPDEIYLSGHSLGRLPIQTRVAMRAGIDSWGERLVGGWNDWIDLPQRVGDRLGETLLGADAGEVVVSDTTTSNLFKLCFAVLESQRLSAQRAIVVDSAEFPTDRSVVAGLAQQRGIERRQVTSDPVCGPTVGDIEKLCCDGAVGVIVLSHVAYRSGAIADMAAITKVAHRYDAEVIWDLSHAVGSIPIDLHAAGVNYAVGCTYKYLNSGPGAPAFLYVSKDRVAHLRSPIWGWFGQKDQFDFSCEYDPLPDARRFLTASPGVLGLLAVQESVKLFDEVDAETLRSKSIALSELLVRLFDDHLVEHGFTLGSPRDPISRGSHVALCHSEGLKISRALIEQRGVIVDFRGPDSIRLALPALYTRFVDVWDAIDRLRDLIGSGTHLDAKVDELHVT